MRQSIVGFGVAVVIAIGSIGLASPAAAQQYCATQADGAPCGSPAHDVINVNSVCKSGECVVEFPGACDGVVCQGGNECLLGDCVPSSCDSVTCTALDQCHAAGVCVPPGTCTNPVKLDGTACDDGDSATTGDRCVSGACTGDPAGGLCSGVVCGAPALCSLRGTCDPATGSCTVPPAPRQTTCGSGFACDGTGTCIEDFCVTYGVPHCETSPPTCTFSGRCDPGLFCPDGAVPAGTECDDGNPATVDDVCTGVSNTCMGMTANPAEPLDLTRATIQARSRGNVRLKGTAPTIDTSTGLTMTVMDGLGLSVVSMVGPDDCRTRASSGRTKCVFRDPAEKRKRVRVILKPSKAGPGMIDFDVFMNKIDAAQPLDGPVMLTIEEGGGTTYEGSIATCQMQALKLRCS